MVKKPFTINIPSEQLADLKLRLKITRWPDEVKEKMPDGITARTLNT